MNRRALPTHPSHRRERALREIADRGVRVAEALAARLHDCCTTDETVRLAEAFSQLSEEVCGAIALEAELRRERESRERERAKAAPPEAEDPPRRPRFH